MEIIATAALSFLWRNDGQIPTPMAVRVPPLKVESYPKLLELHK